MAASQIAWKFRRQRRLLEGIADTEKRRQLLENPARGRVWRRHELRAWKSSEVVQKLRAQKKVISRPQFHTAAGVERNLPHVVSYQAGDLRDRLRKRFGTNDDVALRTGSADRIRTPAVLAIPEMEYGSHGQRMRLPLNVCSYAGRL